MAFKQKSSGLPFKELGSSPVKQAMLPMPAGASNALGLYGGANYEDESVASTVKLAKKLQKKQKEEELKKQEEAEFKKAMNTKVKIELPTAVAESTGVRR